MSKFGRDVPNRWLISTQVCPSLARALCGAAGAALAGVDVGPCAAAAAAAAAPVAAPAVAAVLVLVALPAALDAIDGLAARDAPGPAVIVIDDGEAMTPTTPEPTTPPTKPKTPDSVRAARSPVRFAPDVKFVEAPRRGIFRKISTTRFIKLPKASSKKQL